MSEARKFYKFYREPGLCKTIGNVCNNKGGKCFCVPGRACYMKGSGQRSGPPLVP